jgi:hypothetical protein
MIQLAPQYDPGAPRGTRTFQSHAELNEALAEGLQMCSFGKPPSQEAPTPKTIKVSVSGYYYPHSNRPYEADKLASRHFSCRLCETAKLYSAEDFARHLLVHGVTGDEYARPGLPDTVVVAVWRDA